MSGLGPYKWPLQYVSFGTYAWQWSGNKPDRAVATKILVPAGGTATHNTQLVPGGSISGTSVDSAGQPTSAILYPLSARTGELAGPVAEGGRPATFTITRLAAQDIKLRYHHQILGPGACWYLGQTTFAAATKIKVKAGLDTPGIALTPCN